MRLRKCLRIAGGQQQTLLAPGNADQHGVVQGGQRANGGDVGVDAARYVAVSLIEAVEMDRGGNHLAALQPLGAAQCAFIQGGQR